MQASDWLRVAAIIFAIAGLITILVSGIWMLWGIFPPGAIGVALLAGAAIVAWAARLFQDRGW